MKTKVKNKVSKGKNINFKTIFFSIICFSCLPLILYSGFGFPGLLTGMSINVGVIFSLWTIYKIIKYSFKLLRKYINSKNIFCKKHKNIDYYISKRDSIESSLPYYNIAKLQKQFQQYLFWKNFGRALNSSFIFFIFIYIMQLKQASPDELLFILYTSSIASVALFFYMMKDYFYFLYHKKNIEFIPLSSQPRYYMHTGSSIFFY